MSRVKFPDIHPDDLADTLEGVLARLRELEETARDLIAELTLDNNTACPVCDRYLRIQSHAEGCEVAALEMMLERAP
jgi:C4-type Zn-finger protein